MPEANDAAGGQGAHEEEDVPPPYEAQFSDPRVAVGEVGQRLHQCMDRTPDVPARQGMLRRLRLAVHEWMANLDRHARFEGREPEVRVRIWQQAAWLLCIVEDNARDFNVGSYLDEQPTLATRARALPADGGLGLLLIRASVERMTYDTAVDGPRAESPRNRLHLALRPRPESWTGGAAPGATRDEDTAPPRS